MTEDQADRRTGTALAVSALLIASSALGLLRDLSLAGLFGASSDTDAFFVAWTIPETVAVLLMDGAMSYLLIPVFVSNLASRESITRVVQLTMLPLLVTLAFVTGLVIVGAPVLVGLLAPGIENEQLAIRCFQVAGSTVLFMGLNGYLMAALRANQQFVRPATSYIAYNTGILACMFVLHTQLGVFSAALGLAVGSALMVLVQLPAFRRLTPLRGLRLSFDRRLLLAGLAFLPIAAYSAGRQGQIFVERFVASFLDPGSISFMNYASKVAQMAPLLALTAAAIAFPTLARLASDERAFRTRVEHEARSLILLIVPATGFFCFFAEPSLTVLFERGAFDPSDTALTSDVLRLYSFGLLGQVFTSLGAFVCYARDRRSWNPAIGVLVGLVPTVALDVALAGPMGVSALAVGNAVGISVSAAVIWTGIRRDLAAFDLRGLSRLLGCCAAFSLVAAVGARLLVEQLSPNPLVQLFLGGTVTVAGYLLLTAAVGVPESLGVRRAMSTRAAGAWRSLGRGGRR